ncbi:hypothetical protein AA309_05465 [Microvirga vignae]|uniref:Uncharacterized protein n=1 Tax=Microvirga vignae TaxID=1225564 RepID=A0A0H1RGH7_9HYPH|nr:hypothetical protein [Microvirga vignae]KLK93931.1 hypothetical protein AA309_05465 [Microvirga vignae]
MELADLLLAGDPGRDRWIAAGASMVAVDTLVHNFLRRTGILHRFGAEHDYGASCYGPGGCAELSGVFPWFVQHAVWRFCAQGELDICNGNRIDDRFRCGNWYCPAFRTCDRAPLKNGQA